MENIFDKYSRLRYHIEDGDLILFHGTGIIANIIQNCDKAYYNHIGIVVEKHGALFIIDANAKGVQADRLSWRIGKYKVGDFCIIKPTIDKTTLNYHLSTLLKRSDKKWIKYDFWNGGKELLNRKFNWSLKVNTSENKDICSDFVSDYAINTKIVKTVDFSTLRVPFPEDYLRFLDENRTVLVK